MSFGSKIYQPLFGTEAMRALWSDENVVRSWLEVERAVAEALAAEGFFERSAVASIHRAAQLDNVDLESLRERTRSSGMPIKPLVDQVVAAGDEHVARYFHWGATTQDILDTGQALRLRSALTHTQGEMRALLERLCTMADEHRVTVMVGRTNSQDALPTTWGLQVSTYAAEMTRHLERLRHAIPRAIVGQFGGAVGHLAPLGDKGLRVRRRVMALLGLPEPTGAWNASQDHIVEVVQLAALIQGTLVRLANDIETQGRTAVGEFASKGDPGASSSMPHKTNPRDANMLQTYFELGQMYGGQSLSLMDQVDVRSAAKRVLSWTIVPDALLVLSAALERGQHLIDELVIDEDRMKANFSQSRSFVMAEALMFALAQKVGRDDGYRIVKAALAAPREGTAQDFIEIMRGEAAVRQHLSEAELERACSPMNYLGCTEDLIDEVLGEARRVLSTTTGR